MTDIRTAPHALAAGAEEVREVKDVGHGQLITTVRAEHGTTPDLRRPA